MAIETQKTKIGIQAVSGAMSVTFDAVNSTINRATGSWTPSYAVGMIVTTSDPTNPGPFLVTAVAALTLTCTGVFTTDAVAASFTITGFNPVGEVNDFSGPGGSAAVIDITTLDSDRKEKLMGLPDEGQLTFSVNFVPGNVGQVAFRAARSTRALTNFILAFSDGTAVKPATTATFAGFALEFSVGGAVDDKVTGSATIEITGVVTWSDE